MLLEPVKHNRNHFNVGNHREVEGLHLIMANGGSGSLCRMNLALFLLLLQRRLWASRVEIAKALAVCWGLEMVEAHCFEAVEAETDNSLVGDAFNRGKDLSLLEALVIKLFMWLTI